MTKAPASVQEYLDSLPAERRTALQAVRKVIHSNLDVKVKRATRKS